MPQMHQRLRVMRCVLLSGLLQPLPYLPDSQVPPLQAQPDGGMFVSQRPATSLIVEMTPALSDRRRNRTNTLETFYACFYAAETVSVISGKRIEQMDEYAGDDLRRRKILYDIIKIVQGVAARR